MVGNAQRRVATLAYLVSGDDDLSEAVESAQEFGTQVILLGVPHDTHRLGVAGAAINLAITVDRIVPISSELIRDTIVPVTAGLPPLNVITDSRYSASASVPLTAAPEPAVKGTLPPATFTDSVRKEQDHSVQTGPHGGIFSAHRMMTCMVNL